MSLYEQFGKYAPYIVSAYLVAGLTLGAMIISSIRKSLVARRRLEALEARGLKLRDDR